MTSEPPNEVCRAAANETPTVVFDTPFLVNGNTTIPFGKFRSKPHSILLLEENSKYVDWIIKQGEDFKYSSSRQWLMDSIANKAQDVVIRINKEDEDSDVAGFQRKLEQLLVKFPFVSVV